MPITVSWYDDEKRIVLREMRGNWDWEDFYTSQTMINDMLQQVPHVVDQIIDTRKASAMPQSALTHFRSASKNVPENAGIRVVVGSNAFYQMIFKILKNVFPNVAENVILLPDMDAALKHIAEKRREREEKQA